MARRCRPSRPGRAAARVAACRLRLGNHTRSPTSRPPRACRSRGDSEDDASARAAGRRADCSGHGDAAALFFRHPYLRTGISLPTKRRVEAFTGRDAGTTIAPVTVYTEDYSVRPRPTTGPSCAETGTQHGRSRMPTLHVRRREPVLSTASARVEACSATRWGQILPAPLNTIQRGAIRRAGTAPCWSAAATSS